jgi:hypothetical protein
MPAFLCDLLRRGFQPLTGPAPPIIIIIIIRQ